MEDTYPTENQILNLLQRCMEAEESGTTRFKGMSYEQGVMTGILWMLEQEECDPLEGGKIVSKVPMGPFE